MYAVISSGGKQYRVEEGQQLAVERLGTAGEVDLAPVLVVDGDHVLATPDQLAAASVRARVIGDSRGPKIDGFTYKPKTNQRRRWGHRQRYSLIEITTISSGGARRASAQRAATDEPAETAPPKKAPAKKAPAAKRPAKK